MLRELLFTITAGFMKVLFEKTVKNQLCIREPIRNTMKPEIIRPHSKIMYNTILYTLMYA